VTLGLIDESVTLVARDFTDWVNLSTGGLLLILGAAAIYAGMTKSTLAAKQYLCCVILWILSFGVVFTASSLVAAPDASSSDILITVLVGIFFPFFYVLFVLFVQKGI